MTIPARLSFVTLGVKDLDQATRFYQARLAAVIRVRPGRRQLFAHRRRAAGAVERREHVR
ncbi:MAG: hypothetical protein E6I60_15995 [Chloroflexi bacterium]|nr:MAG: hypothetical protein E6I60_15995 [Chloroflexota bacterium]